MDDGSDFVGVQGAALLESLVDRHTLAKVLAALAEISAAKANHIETNWQESGRSWSKASIRLMQAASAVQKIGV